ncbi:MAG: hypothetical protein P4L83_06745, partial [Nevskia sp.]|nr:hypothetical protein [Nevskia sp.]
MRLQNAVCAVVMAAAMLAATAAASPLPESQVPAPLKTWIAWALHDRDLRDCPVAHDNGAVRTCDWPSRLRLELSGNGGRFELRTKLDAQGWALLPGGDKAWPQDVRVDGRPAPVASHAGTPALYLAAGSYVIAGGFEWTRLPESLAVPQNTGLVSLSVNGAEHTHPTRSADSVWLGRSAPQDLAGDRLALQVYRLVDDDIPLRVVTHIGIEAAGQVREERFGPVLLPDLKPLEIASPLPARIDESGFLNVQLRPGVWSIDVTARAAGPVTDLKLPQLAAPWPAEEVWSFAPHNNLRIVEISGVPAVDPQQAQVPTPWRSNRAYALKSGETLHLSEKQRGDPHPQAGTIALQRQLWLDFDGRGYTVRDSLRGRIGDQWRLDATAPLRLGSVTLDGEPQPITRRSGDDQGVEVRHAALELVAASRIEGRVSRLPVNGWDHEVQGVDTVLRLPPGWRLFAASGVDNVPQTWVGRWSLLDLFAVLIAAAAALRLFGLRWGGLMLLMLLLSWQEAAAPRWSWLNLIATVALLRALPASFRGGRLETWLARYRMLAALVLLLLAIPFALQQARSALYPQLEHAQIPLNPISYQASLKHQVSLNEDAASGEPRPEPMVTEPEQAKEEGARMPTEAPSPPMAAPAVSGRSALSAAQSQAEAAQLSSLRKKAMLAQQAQLSQQAMRRFEPGALTPTGPGLPDWEWTAADLSWSGPVSGAQDFRLWLLPPVLTRLLELLSIVLVAAMLGRCLEWQRPPPPRARGG